MSSERMGGAINNANLRTEPRSSACDEPGVLLVLTIEAQLVHISTHASLRKLLGHFARCKTLQQYWSPAGVWEAGAEAEEVLTNVNVSCMYQVKTRSEILPDIALVQVPAALV